MAAVHDQGSVDEQDILDRALDVLARRLLAAVVLVGNFDVLRVWHPKCLDQLRVLVGNHGDDELPDRLLHRLDLVAASFLLLLLDLLQVLDKRVGVAGQLVRLLVSVGVAARQLN